MCHLIQLKAFGAIPHVLKTEYFKMVLGLGMSISFLDSQKFTRDHLRSSQDASRKRVSIFSQNFFFTNLCSHISSMMIISSEIISDHLKMHFRLNEFIKKVRFKVMRFHCFNQPNPTTPI